MKFTMVSRIEFDVNDDMDLDIDIIEACNSGEIKFKIAEASVVDEEGHDIADKNDVIKEVMKAFLGEV